jgi:unsaturated rhamnogalacturonyl hydrolase
MADTLLVRAQPFRWCYQDGLVMKGFEQVWRLTGEMVYFDHILQGVEGLITPDGGIKTYEVSEYNLDQINPGKLLFPLLSQTRDLRYRKAADLLFTQLAGQPRTHSGGFWHKKIYPFQMWLDGIYMAAPFYAEYALVSGRQALFNDVCFQILHIASHTHDPYSGLFFHGWDESHQQRWANPLSGCSPHFWGRAVGWYAMAIVDTLDYLPASHPQRQPIIDTLVGLISSLGKVQDKATGLWFQILDLGSRAGNYLEASCSCMFVYAIAKAVRLGWIDHSFSQMAQHAYQGILDHLVAEQAGGLLELNRICAGAGLGGTPYRDGSYEYYIGEKITTNDRHGVGAFLLASAEMERARSL